MKIEKIAIDKLLLDPANARKHGQKNLDSIKGSLAKFGQQKPIVVNADNVIVAGNGTMQAAKELGWKEINIVRTDLKGSDITAFGIADNRTSELAEWDDKVLQELLEGLKAEDFDLSAIGFDIDDMNEMIGDKNNAGLTDPDDVPEPPKVPKTKLGDIWQLGNHRLMCGDSTSIDAVDRLLAGSKPDMTFTDPPYNINYQDMKGEFDKIKNDKMSDSDFKDFLVQTIYPSDTMYVCCSWHYAHLFREAMIDIGKPPKAMIVWDKINPAQNLDKYFKQHEIIWYHGKFGGQKTLRGDVWQVKRQRNTVHPTMKPIELIEIALGDQREAKTVVDLFGGSGSTLIACEKTGRHARLMELDPKYCDVIIQRYIAFKGTSDDVYRINADGTKTKYEDIT